MSWTSSSRSSSNSISPVSSRSYLAKLRGASGFRNGFGRWSDGGASLVDTRNCRAAGARVVDDLAEDVGGAALRFRQRHLRRLQEPHEEAHELELVHAVRPARRDARRGRGPQRGTPRSRTNPRPSASSRSRWRSPSPPARARRATAAPHRRRTAGRGAHRRAAPSQQEKAGPHEPRGALLPRAAVGQANVDVISESAAAARCFESAARVRCALPRAHTHK